MSGNMAYLTYEEFNEAVDKANRALKRMIWMPSAYAPGISVSGVWTSENGGAMISIAYSSPPAWPYTRAATTKIRVNIAKGEWAGWWTLQEQTGDAVLAIIDEIGSGTFSLAGRKWKREARQ